MSISKSFTAEGLSASSLLRPGQRAGYSISGTYTGVITLEEQVKGGPTRSFRNVLGTVVSATDAAGQGVVQNDTTRDMRVIFRASGTVTGTCVATLTDLAEGTDVTDGIGAGNGATVIVREKAGNIVHQTTLVFTNLPLTLADATVGAGVKIYDFPEGRIQFLGATGSIAMMTTSTISSTLNSGVTTKWGVGSTTQANATLATTEQDIIPVTTLTSSATINVAGAVSKAALAATFQLDGTTTPVDAFLNVSIPTATDIDADATVLINGSVTITWINLGDY